MISTRMWRALGVGGTVFVAAMLIGITKSIFGIVPSTNLFSTGITYEKMTLGIEVLDTGVVYIRQGLEFLRGILLKIAEFIPVGDSNLVVTAVFLLASLVIGNFIAKRFVVRPFSLPYLPWTLIIAISIFLNLKYF